MNVENLGNKLKYQIYKFYLFLNIDGTKPVVRTGFDSTERNSEIKRKITLKSFHIFLFFLAPPPFFFPENQIKRSVLSTREKSFIFKFHVFEDVM